MNIRQNIRGSVSASAKSRHQSGGAGFFGDVVCDGGIGMGIVLGRDERDKRDKSDKSTGWALDGQER